jgi:nucleoid-associated protein YgaU
MLSGNGRHRRPRQAPALVVAAGVTGSAIAIPLLGASGASAADGTAWDRVAECETGGAWSENSGNGYYGGLQLTQDDWEKYGGLAYASSADQASRSQQIRVAEKVLAAQGIAAWPTCGLLAGLGNGSGSATGTADGASSASPDASGTPDGSASTGSPESPESSRTPETSGSSPSADPSASPDSSGGSAGSGSSVSPGTTGSPGSSSTPSPSGTPDGSSAKEDERAKSGATSDSTPDTASGPSRTPDVPEGDGPGNSGQEGAVSGLTDTGSPGGRHRGPSAPEDPADRRGDASSGRHASRGEEAARDAVDGSYTVRSGDSLWVIADSLDLGGGWQGLYAGNKETIGADPDHILPGQELAITAETGEK